MNVRVFQGDEGGLGEIMCAMQSRLPPIPPLRCWLERAQRVDVKGICLGRID